MLNKLNLETTEIQDQNQYKDREGLVYARVSSKRQEIEGTGLQSQEGRCIAELERIGVPYKQTFPDSYTGGGDFMNRPAMRAMIDYVDRNPNRKFLVIFDDLKRFARDVEFHLKLKTAFRVRNVKLKCLNHDFDESPTGRYVETILAAGNELERHQNRIQVIQKQRSRLDLGYWAFGSKKGYKMTRDSMHGMLSIPNKEGLEVLKLALESFALGEFVRKIDACKFLVEKGFWKRQHPSAYIDKFTYILRDPFYMGDIEYLPWGVTRRKGRHQGIISPETFDLIQARLGDRGLINRIRTDSSEDFPFRNLVLCPGCRYNLTGAWANGRNKKYPYYFCQNALCEFDGLCIPRKDIEDGFRKILEENKLKPEIEKIITAVFEDAWSEEASNLEKLQSDNRRRRSLLIDKIEKFADMAEQAKSSSVRDIYEKRIERIKEEIDEIDNGPLDEVDLSTPYRTALDKSIGLIKSPYSVWEKAKCVEKQRLFYFLFEEKLEYSKKEGYRTDKLPYAVRLFEEFVVTNPLDVEMPTLKSDA